MNAAIYIRKSRENHAKPSYRLVVQREQLPEYAKQQGWHSTIYDDGHASAARGKTELLPERARLEADIRAGKINIILVIELSRLSRDDTMQDYVAWLTLCADHYACVTKNKKNACPASKMINHQTVNQKVLKNLFFTLANGDRLREWWFESRRAINHSGRLQKLLHR